MSPVAAATPAQHGVAAAELAAEMLREHLPLETGVRAVAALPERRTVLVEGKTPLSGAQRRALTHAAARVLSWFGLAGAVVVRITCAGSGTQEAPKVDFCAYAMAHLK